MAHLFKSTLTNRSSVLFRFQVRNMHLLYDKAFVDGVWTSAKSGKTFDVTNPVNDKVITSVPDMNREDVSLALEAASKAFQSWQDTTAKVRSGLLRNWFNLLEANKKDLAVLVTAETGKPLSESLGEITYGNSFIEWFADGARRVNGKIVASQWPKKEIYLTRQPIGVVSVITPWNFPFAMITRKVGALTAAGCTCVIKPSEDTPLTALAAVKLAKDAGIPDGVINVITSSRNNAVDAGKLLCESDLVAGLSFTGSTAVGKILYRQCAVGVKHIGLELGGNAPFIVFPSANLDLAINCAIACKFRNNGQTCVCANRFLLHESVYDKFVNRLKEAMSEKLVLGDGMQDGITAGPLINNAQLAKVKHLVDDALKKGAKAEVGGKPATEIGERYYHPTILTGVTPDMEIYREEIFGPVVSCIKFSDEVEALKVANSTRSGLASYIFSNDFSQIQRVTNKLEFGMIGVNEGVLSACEPEFGGIKESGIGREGGTHGIEEYTYIKYKLMAPSY